MSYVFRPMFQADEEEAMSNMDTTVKLMHAVAKMQFQAGAVKLALDFEALIANLTAELADAAGLEAELELTFPSERSPELQRRGRGLERIKRALRLAQAGREFVKVYDEVTRP